MAGALDIRATMLEGLRMQGLQDDSVEEARGYINQIVDQMEIISAADPEERDQIFTRGDLDGTRESTANVAQNALTRTSVLFNAFKEEVLGEAGEGVELRFPWPVKEGETVLGNMLEGMNEHGEFPVEEAVSRAGGSVKKHIEYICQTAIQNTVSQLAATGRVTLASLDDLSPEYRGSEDNVRLVSFLRPHLGLMSLTPRPGAE